MDESMIVGLVIVGGLLVAVFARMAALEQRLRTLSRLDAKLDALLKHSGISFDPYRDVPPDVVEALQRGKKIEAIKRHRAATGTGLSEAKEFVEELERRTSAGR